jgi:arginase
VRHIAVLDAPSNLGLRPPTATSVPGCAKAPGALRDQGLLTRLGARDAGCLTPPRYDAGDWRPGDGVAHAAQIAAYSRALADRIGAILDAGEFPVILGGDCSILLGSGIAMHRLGQAVDGNIGLVFVDGHSDFRHPGNASYVGAAAGEDLALVTGRGQPDLASIEGRRPYFRDVDVVVLGIRAQDEYRLDLQAAGIITRPVPALRAEGAARSAQWARDQLTDCAGYWVHVDVDVLDPAVMPAVDAPSPGGIAFPELELLLAGLVESPHCLGVEITVFDPDYDPDGAYAAEITSAVTAGLAAAHRVAQRPDLAAARRDLDSAPRTSAEAARAHHRDAEAARERENAEAARAHDRDDEAAREHRRAEAAAESVSLAAAGASGGVSGTPEEPALPATTLLAVEEGADLPAERSWDEAIDPLGHDTEAPVDTAADGQLDPAGESEAEATTTESTADWPEPEPVDAAAADEFDPAVPDSEEDEAGDEPAGFAPDNAAGEDIELVRAVREAPARPSRDETDPDRAALDGGRFNGRRSRLGPRKGSADGETAIHLLSRPLGSAPLLDSDPLPATRPGMLRPRRSDPDDDRPGAADSDTAEGFSLPTQRPAFDVGSDEPADIA